MNLYLPNGYLDIPKILGPSVFNTFIFVGPRGSGKSFGVLDYLTKQDEKFIYMRTQQTELDLMSDPEVNPFNDLNSKFGTEWYIKKRGKYLGGVYPNKEDSKLDINIKALCCALSTLYHVRGMNAFEYKTLFYDEFIPEPHIKKMREQYRACKGGYETLNRNRELDGYPAMRFILCGNSDDINNDILAGYHLIDDIFKMREKGQELKDYPDRRLRLIYPFKSPIAEKKRQTANYLGDKNDSYTRMALGNEFVGFYQGNIKTMNLTQFDPLIRVGDLGIFKSKGTVKMLYVSQCTSFQFKHNFNLTDYELKQFRHKFGLLPELYLKGRITFENAYCEIAFNNLIKR